MGQSSKVKCVTCASYDTILVTIHKRIRTEEESYIKVQFFICDKEIRFLESIGVELEYEW